MYWRRLYRDLPLRVRWAIDLPSRVRWAIADFRRSLRIYWYRSDKGAWLFFGVAGAVVAILGLAMQAVFAIQDERRNRTRELQQRSVACLARNIYFEARG